MNRLDPLEHQIQAAFIEWCGWSYKDYPDLDLIYSAANGGYRLRKTAGIMKAEGVKKGVPDLFLPVPIRPYHGLYIEVKAKGGRLTPEQKVYIKRLTERGYRVRIGWSLEELIDIIIDYYKGE